MLKRRSSKDRTSIRLNAEKQSLLIDDRAVDLPLRPLRVLIAIISAAPELASREALIRTVWKGNFLTGEKALTQAVWKIRAYLNDHGLDPDWIRTVSGEGYQWIGPSPAGPQANIRSGRFKLSPRPVLAFLSLCATSGLFLLSNPDGHWLALGSSGSFAVTGANATIDHRDHALTVTHPEGCVFNFITDENTQILSPSISADGEKLAMTVLKGAKCELRVFEFKTRKTTRFEGCAV